jgi:isopenicillin-N N-acyltransferase-like protein
VILRAILDAPNLPAALDAVAQHRRSAAANYLVASREGMAVDIETAPGDHSRVWLVWPQDGTLAHANHYTGETGRKDVGRWWMPDSPFRLQRATTLLAGERGRISPETLQTLMRDHVNHPVGICSHPDPSLPELEQDMSVAGVLFDLDSATMWLADGQPCEHEFRRVEYASLFGRPSTAG